MADIERRRFLAAVGLVPLGVLLLAGCPGGGEDGGGEEGGGEDEGDDD